MTFGILVLYSIGMKIRAHKRFFRALGTIVSRKFGHSPISYKVRGNTDLHHTVTEDDIVLMTYSFTVLIQ